MIGTMKKHLAGAVSCVILFLLTSCNLPFELPESTPDATSVYITVVAIMTEKAATINAQPTQPVTTPVPIVITPTAGAPTASITSALATPSVDVPCDLAKPGAPLDVTIPDESRLEPGKPFTKIWRFINGGSCTWTRDYAVVWFSGDDLGLEIEQPLLQEVRPGESIDVSVDMVAPTSPGVYSSYWMLRNGQGTLFGLGPSGDAPFWVRIQVIAVSTATEIVTSIPTNTPVVEVSGNAILGADQGFDLDSGIVDQGDENDLVLSLVETDQYQLMPVNSAQIGVYGLTQPGLSDCQAALLSSDGVDLSKQQTGVYLCYRTNQGLVGLLLLNVLPDQDIQLEMEYLTWAVP